jgi:FKBP-type peptidyl-prolyl cis-trans isomerase
LTLTLHMFDAESSVTTWTMRHRRHRIIVHWWTRVGQHIITHRIKLLYQRNGVMSTKVIMDKVIEGDGKTIPKKGNVVTVHYTGTLPDGSVFDSTELRKKPFKFRVDSGEVIKGWDEGIKNMSKGERSKMTIPPQLAYGEKGFPGLIPGRTSITFEVTLLDVS